MLNWLKITLVLCLFGTLRELRPSEPFVTQFLLGHWRNITEDQLNREVYPVATYSYLALLVVVFLITDFLRFKPVIILSGLSGISVYAVLLWTESLQWLQVSQFLYGLYMATEVAYLTYIYAKVDSAKYPIVSAYTRIAALNGRFLSGVTSQLLTQYDVMDYRELNYITFTAQILATFWAFWLPPVSYGIYFHRRSIMSNLQVDINGQNKTVDTHPERNFRKNLLEAMTLISRHARAAYTRPKVLAWSVLYAAALALFVQAQTYMQMLWIQIQDESHAEFQYNGAVEAALTLLGALGAYIASYCSQPVIPAAVAAVQGVATFVGTYVTNLFVSYAGYIVMGMLYHFIITLASAKIASQLSDESCFGLIFGINTLIGTALQSLLTFILVQTLTVSITVHYFVLSFLFVILAIFWLIGWIAHICIKKSTVSVNC